MKVFISWSGDVSKAVALALRDWLPLVVQAVEPFMSDKDIMAGSNWDQVIGKNLKDAKAGILCMTADNMTSPSILFEAGACQGQMDEKFMCPYLYKLDHDQIQWPLARFQMAKADKPETLKIVTTLNLALGQSNERQLTDAALEKAYEALWPQLWERLDKIEPPTTAVPARADREILNEILETVRSLSRERAPSFSPILTYSSLETNPGLLSLGKPGFDFFATSPQNGMIMEAAAPAKPAASSESGSATKAAPEGAKSATPKRKG